MFNKPKIKKTEEENTKLASELKFDIYKMPKNYKIGRFDEKKIKAVIDKNNNASLTSSEKVVSDDSHKKNKKIGIVLLIIGSLLIVFLIYLIIAYASGSKFSLGKALSFDIFKKTETNVVENLGGKNIADIIQDNSTSTTEETVSTTTEEEVATSTEVLEENNSTTTVSIEPLKLIDSDGDGLYDNEEDFLGTDKFKLDSDSDNYSDFQEVQNLYNPLGQGALDKNINISKYSSVFFKYSLLYPFNWEVNALSDDSSVILSIDDNSFVQVLVEDNEGEQNIRAWYANRFFDFVGEEEVVKGKGWQGVYSSDKTAFYLTNDKLNKVYTILYNTLPGQEGAIPNILGMIIKSFSLN